MDVYDEVVKFTEAARTSLLAHLATQPWWCAFCGESGNGHKAGMDYWFPPKDHECDLSDAKPLVGLQALIGDD